MRLFFPVILLITYLSIHGQQKKAEGVGFKTIVIYDSSRNFSSNSNHFEPRPIIVFVWYPALKNNIQQLMMVKDIITHNSLSVFGQQVLANEEKGFKQITANYPFRGELNADSLFAAAMNTTTLAAENASPLKGNYPFILFGNGMNAAGYLYYRQCEWLAQHGYVAAVVASKFQYRDSLPTFNQAGIDAQWQDMYKAMEVVRKENYVDTTSIGIAAWSVGGVSSAILQNKLPQMKAFLSLDAGITYEYGKELLKASPHFKRMSTIPLYELRGAILNQVPRSRYYFDSLASVNRCMLTMADLDHYHFTSVANLLQQLSLNDKKKADAFEFVNRLMLTFFDATIKKDQEAIKRLQELSGDNNFVLKKECRDK